MMASRRALAVVFAICLLSGTGAASRPSLIPPAIPAPKEGSGYAVLRHVLSPMTYEEFFTEHYTRDSVVITRTNSSFFSEHFKSPFVLDEALSLYESNGMHNKILKVSEGSSQTALAEHEDAHHLLAQGKSILLRFEDLPRNITGNRVLDPFSQIGRMIGESFGADTTTHLYATGRGATSRALRPHTDPYDVIVLQLEGSKDWTTCVPQSTDPATAGLSDGDLAQVQEQRRNKIAGCTMYTDADLERASMKCTKFTLKAGETLYMPKGTIHHAITSTEQSTHLTISIGSQRGSWGALVEKIADVSLPNDAALVKSALKEASHTIPGLAFTDAFPAWLLGENRDDKTHKITLVSYFVDLLAMLEERILSSIEAPYYWYTQQEKEVILNRLKDQDAVWQAMTGKLDVVLHRDARANPTSTQHTSSDGSFKYTCIDDCGCDSNNVCNAECGCNAGCSVAAASCECDDITQCPLRGSCACDHATTYLTGCCGCDSGPTYQCTTNCGYKTSCACDADYQCNTSCDECDSIVQSNCYGGCDADCNLGCNYDCDSNCDTCYSNCYAGCDECDAGCDYCSGCNICDAHAYYYQRYYYSCGWRGWSTCTGYRAVYWYSYSCDGCNYAPNCHLSSCDYSCDSNCDYNCYGSCTGGCDGSCDMGCNYGCNANCDICYSSYATSCDGSCDGTCSYTDSCECDDTYRCDGSCGTFKEYTTNCGCDCGAQQVKDTSCECDEHVCAVGDPECACDAPVCTTECGCDSNCGNTADCGCDARCSCEDGWAGDPLGGGCFPDQDRDGVPDKDDNCITIPNPTQANADGDQWGDACDLCPDAGCGCSYTEVQDGGRVCGDRNECKVNNGGCSIGHTCIEGKLGEISCKCNANYILEADGRTCTRACDLFVPATCPTTGVYETDPTRCAVPSVACPPGVLGVGATCSVICPPNYSMAGFGGTTTTVCQGGTSWTNNPDTLLCVRNNNPPTDIILDVSAFQELYVGVIGTFTTIDAATPLQSHTYTIQSQSQKDLYVIQDGNLKVTRPIDFESEDKTYSVAVTSTDNGSPRMSFTKTFHLTVYNDNEPPTKIELSNQLVKENLDVNTFVASISVTDDAGPDQITITMINDGQGHFKLDPTDDRKILTARKINFEATPSLQIAIKGTDAGGRSKSSVFTMTIEDQNDPITDVTLDNLVIAESAAVGSPIGNIGVVDQDQVNGQTYVYSLAGDLADKFEVVGSVLKLKNTLDHEAVGAYALTITATDQWPVVADRSSMAKPFTITIIDVDEGPTNFAITSKSVEENKPINTVVGVVSADADIAGDTLTWELTTDASGRFVLDGTTLKTNKVLDFEAFSTHTVVIKATTNSASKTKSWNVDISVINVNDKPQFTASTFTGSVPEYLAEKEERDMIVTVSATDEDQISVPRLAWSDMYFYFKTPNALFDITSNPADRNEAIISAKPTAEFDYETTDQYTYTIVIQNGVDDPSSATEAQLVINIESVNEPPTSLTMTPAVADGTVNENLPLGEVVATLQLTDPDVRSPPPVYTCVILSTTAPVRMDGLSVTVAGLIDYEAMAVPATLTYDVMCDDGGSPVGRINRTFSMPVNDRNDQPTAIPFTPDLSTYEVEENTLEGHVIVDMSTTDEDPLQTHIYSILNPTGKMQREFKVVGNQIQVATKVPNLGCCPQPQYDYIFEIVSVDQGLPEPQHMNVTRWIHIHVLDVNDPPTDIIADDAPAVMENIPGRVEVGRFSTVDLDHDNNTYTYTVLSNTLEVPLNFTDNVLWTVTHGPNYEANGGYGTIRVRTCDDGVPMYCFEKNFNVTIYDVNEAPTDIILDSEDVDENSPVDTLVANIDVADPDDAFPPDQDFSCVIDNAWSPFKIVGHELLVAEDVLDFEVTPWYQVNITCTDAGTPNNDPMSIFKSFMIAINDINDAPTDVLLSGRKIIRMNLQYNLTAETTLGTLSSEDQDLINHNQTHNYTIGEKEFATSQPTAIPTRQPTPAPSPFPTTPGPTTSPTENPTAHPTTSPTANPTLSPTFSPPDVFIGMYVDGNCTQEIMSWNQRFNCYSPGSSPLSLLTECFGDFGAPLSASWTWTTKRFNNRDCDPSDGQVTANGVNGACVFIGDFYIRVNCTDQGTSTPTTAPTTPPTLATTTEEPTTTPPTTVEPVTTGASDVTTDPGASNATGIPATPTDGPETTPVSKTELSTYTVNYNLYPTNDCTGAASSVTQSTVGECQAIDGAFITIRCFTDGTFELVGASDAGCSNVLGTLPGTSSSCIALDTAASAGDITCVAPLRRRRAGGTVDPTTADPTTAAAADPTTAAADPTTGEPTTTTEERTTTSSPTGSPTPSPTNSPTVKPDDFYLEGEFGEILKVRGEHFIGKDVTLEIVSTDDGGLRYVKNINVKFVEDANTPPARLVQRVYNVEENSARGTEIGVVQALDFDIPAQDLRYTLDDAGLASRFAIDAVTGNLTVAASNVDCLANGGDDCLLNFEANKNYVVNIRATDNGSPPKSTVFGVLVRLDNVNDRPRNILLDESDPTATPAAAVFDIGKFEDRVGQVSCTDEESGQTHHFYKVDGTDNTNLFTVERDTGVVRLARNLTQDDRSDLQSNATVKFYHNLVVQCVDNGSPELDIEGIFNIEIKDTEEEAYQTAKAYYIREIETATTAINPNSMLKQAKSVYKNNNGFYWGPYERGNTTDEVMQYMQEEVATEKAKAKYDSCKAIQGSSTAVRFQCFIEAYNKFGGQDSADTLALEHEKIHGDAPQVTCKTCPYNLTFSMLVSDFDSLVSPNDSALVEFLVEQFTGIFEFAEQRLFGFATWKQVQVSRRRAPTPEMDVTYGVSLPVNATIDNQPMQDIIDRHYDTILHQREAPVFSGQQLSFVPQSFHAVPILPAAASSSGSSAGMMPIIAAVAGLLIIVIIIVIVVMRKKRNDGRTSSSGSSKNAVVGSDRHVTSFVNPVYEENTTKLNPMYDETAHGGGASYEENFNDVDGLYDEMPGAGEGDDDYLDMPGFDENAAVPDDSAFDDVDDGAIAAADEVLYDAPGEGAAENIYDNGNFEKGFDEENIYDNNEEDFGADNFDAMDFGEEDEGGYLDVKPEDF